MLDIIFRPFLIILKIKIFSQKKILEKMVCAMFSFFSRVDCAGFRQKIKRTCMWLWRVELKVFENKNNSSDAAIATSSRQNFRSVIPVRKYNIVTNYARQKTGKRVTRKTVTSQLILLLLLCLLLLWNWIAWIKWQHLQIKNVPTVESSRWVSYYVRVAKR